MKHLRPAADLDWRRFYGIEAPAYWSGLVFEDKHMILGIGGLYCDDECNWWAFLKRAPGVGCAFTAQRAALITLNAGIEAGLTIHAIADPAIVGSAKWLRRLGFEETSETVKGFNKWIR